ncbi:MAG: hypothetical protein ISR82_01295 [Candidatus Marinimicrobia bacterium]|nr:hypothetical protein [Candidatus Neomarinimicrobiota bacterium]MBL7009841.1 hypothetical protein [Candidatus Neomarinimicrobiota bacterium]MBL7029920.1 hypothetical protein [Candidatus Neomarinimicrobiota bacterium]
MKLIKLIIAAIMALGLIFAQTGQPSPPPCDPNASYPVADPGPDGGCANYNDCNGNGAYDVGEPCADGGQGGGPDPVWEAFASALESGASPQDAFNAAADKVHELEVGSGNMTQEEYDEGRGKAQAAYDQALADGKSPEEAFGDAMAAAGPPPGGEGQGGFYCAECDMEFATEEDMHNHMTDHHGDMGGDPAAGTGGDQGGFYCAECNTEFATEEEMHNHMADHHGDMGGDPATGTGGDQGGYAPTNHWDANCGALCSGMGDYYLDSDGDGNAEDGPYATWDHDADGNPVDCGCGDGGGDHEGDQGPMFEDVDANGDGVIDRDEARAFFGQDEEGNPNPDFDQKFDEADTNGDGVVDHAEFEAAGPEDGDGGGDPNNN